MDELFESYDEDLVGWFDDEYDLEDVDEIDADEFEGYELCRYCGNLALENFGSCAREVCLGQMLVDYPEYELVVVQYLS